MKAEILIMIEDLEMSKSMGEVSSRCFWINHEIRLMKIPQWIADCVDGYEGSFNEWLEVDVGLNNGWFDTWVVFKPKHDALMEYWVKDFFPIEMQQAKECGDSCWTERQKVISHPYNGGLYKYQFDQHVNRLLLSHQI